MKLILWRNYLLCVKTNVKLHRTCLEFDVLWLQQPWPGQLNNVL